MNCPLCCSARSSEFFKGSVHGRLREYRHCSHCDLVFLLPQYFLSAQEEKALYDTHKISMEDSRCRQFFLPLVEAIGECLGETPLGEGEFAGKMFKGLDFGCGQVPLLAEMFRERNMSVEIYDKYYFPNENVLSGQYSFITATEVFEHLVQPQEVLEKLLALLWQGGFLGIMTKLFTDDCDFEGWYYKNDPTHIVFYSKKTFQFISEKYGLNFDILSDNLVLLQKPL